MSETSTTEPTAPTPPVSKSDIMHSVGKTLLERRTARSLSLEKVSQVIKIRLPYLQAMERGDWDALPGEVYVRGFIRRYANYLGIDGDKLIEPYLKLSELPQEKKVDTAMEAGGPDFGRTQIIWGIIGVVFIIGFLKVIRQEKNTPIKSAAPVAAKSSVDAAPTPSTSTKPEEAMPVVAKHVITVFCPNPLWLHVAASDRTFEGYVPQNSSWTWKGEGVLTIRLGHTKQVVLTYDGKPVPLVDDQKRVVLPSE